MVPGLLTAHSKNKRVGSGNLCALLTQRQSRTGAAVRDYYSNVAVNLFPDLPTELKRLAWLSLIHKKARNIGTQWS